jgi:hypothetical protein
LDPFLGVWTIWSGIDEIVGKQRKIAKICPENLRKQRKIAIFGSWTDFGPKKGPKSTSSDKDLRVLKISLLGQKIAVLGGFFAIFSLFFAIFRYFSLFWGRFSKIARSGPSGPGTTKMGPKQLFLLRFDFPWPSKAFLQHLDFELFLAVFSLFF